METLAVGIDQGFPVKCFLPISPQRFYAEDIEAFHPLVRQHLVGCEDSEIGEGNNFKFEGVWYKPDLYFITEVLGLFPDENNKQLIPPAWIKVANMLEVNGIGHDIAVSMDVARTGNDAAIVVRQGLKVIHLERKKPINKKDPTGEPHSNKGYDMEFSDGRQECH